jgi:hypothetical protein
MKKFFIAMVMLAAIGLGVLSVFNLLDQKYNPHYEISYSDFIEDVRNSVVTEVDIDGNFVEGKRNNGTRFSTYNPNDSRMIDELLEYGVKIKVEKPEQPSTLMQIMISWLPTFLLIAVLVYFMRKQAAMGGRDGITILSESIKNTVHPQNNTSNDFGIASFIFGLISIFALSPIFVPMGFILGIIAVMKNQNLWGVLGIICSLIGLMTSPFLLVLFSLIIGQK